MYSSVNIKPVSFKTDKNSNREYSNIESKRDRFTDKEYGNSRKHEKSTHITSKSEVEDTSDGDMYTKEKKTNNSVTKKHQYNKDHHHNHNYEERGYSNIYGKNYNRDDNNNHHDRAYIQSRNHRKFETKYRDRNDDKLYFYGPGRRMDYWVPRLEQREKYNVFNKSNTVNTESIIVNDRNEGKLKTPEKFDKNLIF
jgi:hypothetical protein